MGYRKGNKEVVYVERDGDSSVKWLFWGAALGAGLALLYAPRSGEETRRSLQRNLWKLRAMTEEKIDELTQQFGAAVDGLSGAGDEEEDELDRPLSSPAGAANPREELEHRLADTRARRRRSIEPEEPLA